MFIVSSGTFFFRSHERCEAKGSPDECGEVGREDCRRVSRVDTVGRIGTTNSRRYREQREEGVRSEGEERKTERMYSLIERKIKRTEKNRRGTLLVNEKSTRSNLETPAKD